MPTWAIYGNARMQGPVLSASSSYTGPADIYSGVAGFWGVRAMSVAYALTSGRLVSVTNGASVTGDVHCLTNGAMNQSDTILSGGPYPVKADSYRTRERYPFKHQVT